MRKGFTHTHEELFRLAEVVTPHDVPFLVHAFGQYELCNRFGKTEVDISAGKLVRFFQAEGGWRAFAGEELRTHYASQGWEDTFGLGILYGLTEDWWDDLGEYRGGWVRANTDGDRHIHSLVHGSERGSAGHS